jgi:ABC-2 type transport system ATP-binding protein
MTKIVLENVTKVIRGNTVTDNVSVVFESGEIIGLKGVNGSGKTMLMRLIAGLILPTGGRILIDGEELGKDITFPRSIGILIENPAFLDSYSGFKNLQMLASIKGVVGDDDVRTAIERVRLDPDDKKKYRKYSLGMKQRLGIAAAVMERPDIVILDEPTNALDSDGVEVVKEILREEKKRGALVIISCHDFETLKSLSDRMYLIEAGRLKEYSEAAACRSGAASSEGGDTGEV